jgi:hypothetical protein
MMADKPTVRWRRRECAEPLRLAAGRNGGAIFSFGGTFIKARLARQDLAVKKLLHLLLLGNPVTKNNVFETKGWITLLSAEVDLRTGK